MNIFSLKVDLLKLKNACRVTIPGKTSRKRGIFIPFEDNSEVYDGEKGVYLNLTVVEMKQPGQYGDTHIVKGNKSEDEYKAMSDEEIKTNFEQMLKKFPGIKGVNNHMGSKFTENRQKMSDIMEILHKHDLFFLDSKTTPKSVGKSTAAQYDVDYAHRHVFLDNNNDKSYILQQLKITERIAQKNGYAVAIGHPKSQTYNALKEWLPTVSDKGLKIVHMSEIVKVLN